MPALVPVLPPKVPHSGARKMRALARFLLRLHGWRVTGTLPDEPRVVMAGLPHTSNWDGYFAILFALSTGLRISLIIKKSWLEGPFGGFMRWMGFIGVDRKAPRGFAEQVADAFRNNDSFWLGVTPEGTRTGAAELKTGFQRIARAADALILPVCIDFQHKAIRLGTAFPTTADPEADTARLLAGLPGLAWPRHLYRLSAPARKALTINGELRRPDPLD